MNALLFFATLAYNQEIRVNNGRKFEFENILHLRLVSSLWNLANELSKFIATALILCLVTGMLAVLLPWWLGCGAADTSTAS